MHLICLYLCFKCDLKLSFVPRFALLESSGYSSSTTFKIHLIKTYTEASPSRVQIWVRTSHLNHMIHIMLACAASTSRLGCKFVVSEKHHGNGGKKSIDSNAAVFLALSIRRARLTIKAVIHPSAATRWCSAVIQHDLLKTQKIMSLTNCLDEVSASLTIGRHTLRPSTTIPRLSCDAEDVPEE